MRILLFIDSNIKTIPYEVPLLPLQQQGHTIIFLSILQRGAIHEEYERLRFPVFSMGEKEITLKHTFQYVKYFIRFCKEQQINVVFAHLAIPSFVGVLGQYFVQSKVICFRHHFNFVNLLVGSTHKVNKADILLDKINAKLASKIILPSQYLKTLIHKNEGVPVEKMEVIPYVYNWTPFMEKAKEKCSFVEQAAPLQLLMISRLTSLKRPELAIEVMLALYKRKIPAQLTIVGVGDKEQELKAYVASLPVAGLVHFAGFQKDVVPFLNDCDYLVHPSMTEASSSVIKEAGIIGRPVIACKSVGDFDEYIVNERNGWLVNPNNFVEETVAILESSNPEERCKIGAELRKTVLEKFSVSEPVTQAYESLLS